MDPDYGMKKSAENDIIQILESIINGDKAAVQALSSMVYEQLRKIENTQMAREAELA